MCQGLRPIVNRAIRVYRRQQREIAWQEEDLSALSVPLVEPGVWMRQDGGGGGGDGGREARSLCRVSGMMSSSIIPLQRDVLAFDSSCCSSSSSGAWCEHS